MAKFSEQIHQTSKNNNIINEQVLKYDDNSKEEVVNTSTLKNGKCINDEITIGPYKIIGQVLNTYIIIDKFDYIYIIDQHAAHEKMFLNPLKPI